MYNTKVDGGEEETSKSVRDDCVRDESELYSICIPICVNNTRQDVALYTDDQLPPKIFSSDAEKHICRISFRGFFFSFSQPFVRILKSNSNTIECRLRRRLSFQNNSLKIIFFICIFTLLLGIHFKHVSVVII